MTNLFTFNPETDIVLALDVDKYTASRRVMQMRRDKAFIQAPFSRPGDMFFAPDMESRWHIMDETRNIVPAFAAHVSAFSGRIMPWGWNKAIRLSLCEAGVDPSLLPDHESLLLWRSLSHRRTAGMLLEHMGYSGLRAVEITDVADFDHIIENIGTDYFVKSPWSSSGRGVFSNVFYPADQLHEFVVNSIARQGSVMLERRHDDALNCATEWFCADGNADYFGLSVFENIQHSRYSANLLRPQDELTALFDSMASVALDVIVSLQRAAIENIIAPHYTGPLGIDMLVGNDGSVHPCIEVNLRMTMGHIAIANSKPTHTI